MKTHFLLGLLMPTVLLTTAAFADDKAACMDAASKGQRLRDTHKLVEARAELRVCATAQCPSVIQSDCAIWLADVEKALPSVVVTAKDGAGADLVDVKVSVDGRPLASKLDGQAVPMNAGPHTFHFEGADGSILDRQVMVKEGERNQAVAVVLGAAAPTPSSTWKTLGWVLGGTGVVGLGVGTVFGVIAMGDKNGAHCDANNVCDPGTTRGIKSAALVSDVGWIAGGVLLAGGAALVLFAPSGSRKPESGVNVAPVVTASGGAIVAGGSW
jgi:hypothetical protein